MVRNPSISEGVREFLAGRPGSVALCAALAGLVGLGALPAAAQDLIVQSLTVTPNPCTAGQSVTITTIARNQGTTAAGASLTRVWRHRTGEPAAGMGGDYSHATDALAAGATQTFADSFSPTYPGSRTAWAYVDSGEAVDETNEGNNARSAPYTINPTNADLTFQSFTVTPDPVSLGNQATITATVVNQGSDPAPSCLVQLWRHRTGPCVIGTTGDYTHTTGAFAPGATETFTSPFYPHFQGSRTAWGLVDSRNLVAENNEDNNKASDGYSIQPGTTPDLVGSVSVSPDPVDLGNSVTVTAGVENSGAVAAGPFPLAAWRHWPAAPIVGSPADVTWPISGLAVGASATRTTTFTPSYSGARKAWVLADNTNVVIENNEGNNIAYQPYGIITGNEPDLVPDVAMTPNPTTIGATTTMTVTVQNTGSSGAGAFALDGWIHRSVAPGVGTTPQVSWPVSSLAAGATATRTHTFVPNYAGARTAWAFADRGQAILETAETNNIASEAYTISATGVPDAFTVVIGLFDTDPGTPVAIDQLVIGCAPGASDAFVFGEDWGLPPGLPVSPYLRMYIAPDMTRDIRAPVPLGSRKQWDIIVEAAAPAADDDLTLAVSAPSGLLMQIKDLDGAAGAAGALVTSPIEWTVPEGVTGSWTFRIGVPDVAP